jgi:LEA14-like dessication related protein
MKASKIIGIIVAFLQIGGSVAFAASIQTMMSVYVSAMPQQQEIEFQPTDPVVIPFTITPNNPGYINAELSVSLSLKSGETVVAVNNAKVLIPPNSRETVEIPLTIPLSQAEQYLIEGTDVEWVANIKVTTLYNLVSFCNQITIMEATV